MVFLITATMMKMMLSITLVCTMFMPKMAATQSNNMFNGKLIAVPIAVSIIDSMQAFDWYRFM